MTNPHYIDSMQSTVKINIEKKKGISIPYACYAEPPFKLMDITQDRTNGGLQLMLMSASPGILDKDKSSFCISLEEGTSLELRTQAYQRIFRMQAGASQTMDISMKQNSSLVYLPHPVVPHEGSVFKGRSSIRLAPGCRLFWGEVFTCGRKHNDEIFKLTSFHNITEVYKDMQLIYRDNLLIEPSPSLTGLGMLEGYTHQAGLIWIDERADMKRHADQLWQWLQEQPMIRSGVSVTRENTLVLRLLGTQAETLFQCLNNIREFAVNKEQTDAC